MPLGYHNYSEEGMLLKYCSLFSLYILTKQFCLLFFPIEYSQKFSDYFVILIFLMAILIFH